MRYFSVFLVAFYRSLWCFVRSKLSFSHLPNFNLCDILCERVHQFKIWTVQLYAAAIKLVLPESFHATTCRVNNDCRFKTIVCLLTPKMDYVTMLDGVRIRTPSQNVSYNAIIINNEAIQFILPSSDEEQESKFFFPPHTAAASSLVLATFHLIL